MGTLTRLRPRRAYTFFAAGVILNTCCFLLVSCGVPNRTEPETECTPPAASIEKVMRRDDGRRHIVWFVVMCSDPMAQAPDAVAPLLKDALGRLTDEDLNSAKPLSIRFIVVSRPDAVTGASTSVSLQRLKQMASAPAEAARRFMGEYAWALGKVPE